MELYSKRNKAWLSGKNYFFSGESEKKEDSFLTESTRNRLLEQFKYISNSDKYLERFLVVHDENTSEWYLYEKLFKDITLREVGYDITEFINLKTFEFRTEKKQDSKIFDFIELILIFCLSYKREELVSRFERIFKEEDMLFAVHGFMIVNRKNNGLLSIAPLIKEELLKKKISEFYNQKRIVNSDYQLLAKISAEILQLIFSSPKAKDKTKEFASKICLRIAQKWAKGKNVKELSSLIEETVKNAKALSNQIADIRHTDRTTIPVDAPNIYKLISSKNINLVELAILSLPENFVMEQNPDNLKKNYIENYGINSVAKWIIEKKLVDEINVKDIPF